MSLAINVLSRSAIFSSSSSEYLAAIVEYVEDYKDRPFDGPCIRIAD